MTDEASEDEMLEHVYTSVDKLLRAECFRTVDTILSDLRPHTLPAVVGLAYASITFAAKDKLTQRAAYMTRLRDHLSSVVPGEVDELLRGIDDA